MQISDEGLALLKRFEGCKLTAYQDGGGVWTIGYGSTDGVREGQTISQSEADEKLETDVEDHDITDLLEGAETSQNQFDAMTSLAFNIGIDAFAGSSVLKRHKEGNYPRAADCFLLWKYDNGVVVPGLLKRRNAERELYLS